MAFCLPVLGLAILLTLSAVPVSMADSAGKGDINLDGKITSTDVLQLKQYLVGTRDLTWQGLQNADLNGDGSISGTDLTLLQNLLTGTPPAAPAASRTKWLQGVPDFKQDDPSWSRIYLGSKTMAQAGCTTTCLAMTESYRTGAYITPADMRGTLRYSGNNLYWPDNYRFYGKDEYSYEEVMRYAYEAINAGKPLIIEGTAWISGEEHTHWVVIVGYTNLDPDHMRTSDFRINDPNSTSRTTLADFIAYRGTITSVTTYRESGMYSSSGSGGYVHSGTDSSSYSGYSEPDIPNKGGFK